MPTTFAIHPGPWDGAIALKAHAGATRLCGTHLAALRLLPNSAVVRRRGHRGRLRGVFVACVIAGRCVASRRAPPTSARRRPRAAAPGPPGRRRPPAAVAAPASAGSTAQCDFYLFSHVSRREDARDYMEQHGEDLAGLLAGPSHKGILVLYTAPGDMWKKMVKMVQGVGRPPESLGSSEIAAWAAEEGERLKALRVELEDMQRYCYGLMQELEARHPGLRDLHRVRIVSPLCFCDILDSVMSRLRQDFTYWMQNTTYDVPKLVDAILRLRGFGNSVPVMRFDEDVLFNEHTLLDRMARVKDIVLHGMQTFEKQQHSLEAQAWVSSGQYVHPGLPEFDAKDGPRFDAWNGAFSTRPNPALLATPALCDAAQFDADAWVPGDAVLEAALDADAMLKFYGLEVAEDNALRTPTPSSNPDDASRREEDLDRLGNTFIGASPMRAVVSGAALCMSPGVVLDLPPFSHFGLNVMWIDDHCLDRSAVEIGGRKHCDTSIGRGNVVKARSRPTNCAWYTLEVYLPTLLYGCILDKWINDSEDGYLLKYLLEDLPPGLVQDRVRAIKSRHCKAGHEIASGPLTFNVRKVIQSGRMHSKEELDALHERLWSTALERIQDVYWQWSRLPTRRPAPLGDVGGGAPAPPTAAVPSAAADVESAGACSTFAGLWATSAVAGHPQLAAFCDAPWSADGAAPRTPSRRRLRLGAGLVDPAWHRRARGKRRRELPPLCATDLNPHMYEAIGTLVMHAKMHLEWVLVWPSVVQAVRSVHMGKLPSDMSYNFDWTEDEEAKAARSWLQSNRHAELCKA